jgi:hypothetical protein
MLTLIKKIWHDPVWSKVVATIFVGIAGYLLDLLEILIQTGKSVFAWLIRSSEISNWIFLITLLCTFIVITFLLVTIWQSLRLNVASDDWKKHYCEDVLNDVLWRWSYLYSGQIDKLHSFCPECDFQVYESSGGAFNAVPHTIIKCDNPSCSKNILCDFQGDSDEFKSFILRSIQQKIRTGNWSKNKAIQNS